MNGIFEILVESWFGYDRDLVSIELSNFRGLIFGMDNDFVI